MSDNILVLNGTSAWIASAFATKSMLCNYEGWAVCAPKLSCLWTVKAINHWHKEVLQKMEDYFLATDDFWDDLPKFATHVFNTANLSYINRIGVNKALELHTRLIISASKLLLTCYQMGPSRHNKSEIEQWFQKLNCFPSQNTFAFGDLEDVKEQYEKLQQNQKRTRQGNGENKFYHEMLLLHIGFMVNLASKKPQKVTCTQEEYRHWSEEVGCWHEKVLNLGSEDRCLPNTVIDREAEPNQEFALIRLPMDNLFRDLNHQGYPNVHGLHKETMDRMKAAILRSTQNNPNDNKEGLKVFTKLMGETVWLLDDSKPRLLNIKKQWQWMLKNKGENDPDSPYKPRKPSNLMDDRFIMGKESYHHIFYEMKKKRKRGQYNMLPIPKFPRLKLIF